MPETDRHVSATIGITAYPRLTEAETLLKAKDYDSASWVVIEHLRQHRNEPRGLALLGEIAMDSGALMQAERFLRQAIAAGASSLEVETSLATTILRQDRLDEAATAFSALEHRTQDPRMTATKAMILDRLGHTAEALDAHRAALTADPGNSQNWIAYGHSLRFAGRTDEAIAAYRKVIAEDPERGEAWWGLADIKSKVITDEDIRSIETALTEAVDALNIVPLHMALARGLHDRADYAGAFEHYRQGNALRAGQLQYDPSELTSEVSRFIQMATPERLTGFAEANGPAAIFLVSLPRSGSTLLEQILGRHPAIEATGELPYIRAVLRSALELRMTRGQMDTPQLILSMSAEEKQALGAEYLHRAAQHRRTDAPYFIDKMPTNWSDILFIRAILPQARFIEIRRGAMDCCFSNFTHHFASAHPSSFDLVHQARSYRDYARLMDHIGEASPGFLASVRYEALVDDPERTLRRTLDYLGLEWDDSLLRLNESDRSIRTPSAEQVRRPINRQGIGVWKPYAEWLQPLRDALGPLADA